MKTILKFALILAITFGATAFTSTFVKKIDIKESSIEWKGKKVLGSHTGTIDLKEGFLEMDGEQLTGGMFVVDMTTISVTDLKSGNGKEKLEGHLKSEDFFGIEKFPTATLAINSATKNSNGFTVIGDLTIKDVTESIEFELEMTEDTASTSLKIDRTKFGVRYGSGSLFDNLGDNTISDIFKIDVTLKF